MALDIRGSIKNTRLSSDPYVVFEELISNSIDAFLIRRSKDSSARNLCVQIDVSFERPQLVDSNVEDLAISCSDNGCGLGEEQLKAFLTKDTSYKDDLAIAGIGSCKGAGRIQFFHHFSSIAINSASQDGDDFVARTASWADSKKILDTDDFKTFKSEETAVGTKITLKGLRDSVRSRVFHSEDIPTLFSATVLKKRMLVFFLQRLIGLRNSLGEFEVSFQTSHSGQEEYDCLKSSDLPVVDFEDVVRVKEQDPSTGQNLNSYQEFKISHYRLDAEKYGLPRNSIAFCAKSSPVVDITNRYLKSKTEQNAPIGGANHIVLIEGVYLDACVNEQRDGFDRIPDDIPVDDLFCLEKISYTSIYEAIDPVVGRLVVPSGWDRDIVLHDIGNEFGISEAMLQDTSTRIVYGDSAKDVAERVLKKYQERVVSETAEIFFIKEEILRSEPDSETFRKKINELSWKYASSIKNFEMASLSQLVVRRAAIVEVLKLACGRGLDIQVQKNGARRKDERIIHSIFFPMRKDSTEVADHDIWLLSEEYYYYDYIASDIPLSSIKWNNGESVFDADVDSEVDRILRKRCDDNSAKRPDIAIFSQEGAAVIIEFKAPGESLDDHVGDLSEYSNLLAAKSGGKIKKFYGYLIGDTVNPLRLNGWTKFPTGNGFFQTSTLYDHAARQQLGETYFEILYYSDVIDRAEKRIRVYKDRLKLDLMS